MKVMVTLVLGIFLIFALVGSVTQNKAVQEEQKEISAVNNAFSPDVDSFPLPNPHVKLTETLEGSWLGQVAKSRGFSVTQLAPSEPPTPAVTEAPLPPPVSAAPSPGKVTPAPSPSLVLPTLSPTIPPSPLPTIPPSTVPSLKPKVAPSAKPSPKPTAKPSPQPSAPPTYFFTPSPTYFFTPPPTYGAQTPPPTTGATSTSVKVERSDKRLRSKAE